LFKQLPSGDLLINSSSGEPSLFTDTPSPASLLADDDCSQDTPVSGCVDLSFLEEALLTSPGSSLGSGGPEVQEDPNVQLVEQQKESEEIWDFLQQSLQEANITEDTLALEAGLAQTVETLQFGLSGTSLPLPSTPYFPKQLTLPGLSSLPKDTQTAVEPPQPSLLAVGPGCPSLKPPGTQLISLLPGNVFPTPPLEASFSINSTQSTSMIIQKTLPTRQMLASTVRTITPSGFMLQKTLLPIQPKLPVSIQPRLVQISPRPSGQKPLQGFAFISTNTSQSVLLSPSVGSKQSLQAQSAPSVSKPVSFNLVGKGGPIVIQPQDPFQGQRQFFLPSQTPATFSQSTSIPSKYKICLSLQYPQKPSASQDQPAATLLVQVDNHISASVGEAEDSLTSLTASETFSSLCESEEILMPTCHGSEHTDILLQSPIGQCSVKTTDTDSMKGSTTPVSDEQDPSVLIALGADPKFHGGPVMSKSPSSSLEKLFMYLEQLGQSHVLTELSRTSESTDHEYKQQYSEHDTEPTVPRNNGLISFNQRELQEKVHLGPRLLAQDKETYSTLQKNQTLTASVDPKEEKLRLTKRQHRFKQQLFLDHSAVLNPNTSAPFVSVEDALRHLLPYHTCARALPNQADFISAESFLMSRAKNSSQHSQVSSVQTGLAGCPPSPPSWTLQSDRPPGLKTYRSSSKGAIRLTIKQESGSRKVIHNSCDASHVISGFKRNYSGQLTKGGAMQGKYESLKPPLSNVAEDKNDQRPDQQNKMKLHLDMETIRTGSDSQNLSDSVATQDYVAPRVQGLLPEQCTPVLKRNKLAASVAESPSLPALVEDRELSEHLQSALDSILELQRLQGSVAGVKPKIQQPRALDQAVVSMLEGEL
ncbi:hypothetical protein cypCar_00004406, partial [Cyprinus carpio]